MENIQQELSFLSSLVKGIANQFGKNCEVVLLDLSNFEERGSVIVAIENGHVTGRKVGDSGTNLGLEVLRGTDKEGDKYNYITQTKSGRILRSTTIYIRNSKGVPIGCLCINLDITDLLMAESTIHAFTQFDDSKKDVREIFVNDVSELMDSLIQDAQHLVGKPVAMMSKEDKVKAIKYLDQKGLFLIKKSGDRVCTYFDISKYTLYSYLEEAREEERNKKAERDNHFGQQ
ncbi:helix-turn-helix transcriptional regulator [Alicyclobacillus macrosporangiidus]|uniref:helix-turn-helix transcriptional regulator n=1 Tax=Alicyclobacillus macrosporangiidus TaxID=392015 RepID=UPI000497E6B1|nr:helix-turn-helix transcriptional regulator [Alicyclobacillus macrosporangiidus]